MTPFNMMEKASLVRERDSEFCTFPNRACAGGVGKNLTNH